MKHQKRILTICRTSLFAALMAISALVSIPTPIPITLQTFTLFLLSDVLPASEALCAVGVYLTLGIIGLPVFSGFQSGVGTLLGPTGGFLVGYLLVSLFYGILSKKVPKRRFRFLFAILCLVMLYLSGGIWYAYLYGTSGVLSICVFPFIIPDLLKIAMAVIIANRFRRFLR